MSLCNGHVLLSSIIIRAVSPATWQPHDLLAFTLQPIDASRSYGNMYATCDSRLTAPALEQVVHVQKTEVTAGCRPLDRLEKVRDEGRDQRDHPRRVSASWLRAHVDSEPIFWIKIVEKPDVPQ